MKKTKKSEVCNLVESATTILPSNKFFLNQKNNNSIIGHSMNSLGALPPFPEPIETNFAMIDAIFHSLHIGEKQQKKNYGKQVIDFIKTVQKTCNGTTPNINDKIIIIITP